MHKLNENVLAATEPVVVQLSDSELHSTRIELINIVLMAISLALAAVVPFELFLLAYAILGPLHYLTEISWLGDRGFFTPRRTDWMLLLVLGLLATLGSNNVLGANGVAWLNNIKLGDSGLFLVLKAHHVNIMFFAFASAIVFVVVRPLTGRILGLGMVIACAILFDVGSTSVAGIYYKLFAVYLPTLIHVFIFTGAFIVAGALKRNSLAGLISFATFLVCGAIAIWMPNIAIAPPTSAPAVFWRGFQELSMNSLNDILRQPTESLIGTNMFTSDIVLRLVRFLAFAYMYHYLNWFSKTSIIGWHTVPRGRLAIIGIVWIASMTLYAVSYDLGLRWLFLLSLSHVLLEFPLNIRSFWDIGTQLRQRFVAK